MCRSLPVSEQFQVPFCAVNHRHSHTSNLVNVAVPPLPTYAPYSRCPAHVAVPMFARKNACKPHSARRPTQLAEIRLNRIERAPALALLRAALPINM